MSAESLRFLTPIEIKVLWAAMQAMVNDIHAPQDTLKEDQWKCAEDLLRQLDEAVNA